MATDINDARSAFEDGVDRNAARKWQNNASESAGEYESEFQGILKDQNDCAQQSEDAAKYERLMEYADCMASK